MSFKSDEKFIKMDYMFLNFQLDFSLELKKFHKDDLLY